ncbi:hypothetical protein CB1_000953002 [Camelus ferus]|nr:hypothetical protein CB1_000953002 [Camelus ferus]
MAAPKGPQTAAGRSLPCAKPTNTSANISMEDRCHVKPSGHQLSVLFEHTQQHVNLTVDRHSRKFRARRGLSHLDLDPKVRSFLAVGTVVDEGAVVQGRDGPMDDYMPVV